VQGNNFALFLILSALRTRRLNNSTLGLQWLSDAGNRERKAGGTSCSTSSHLSTASGLLLVSLAVLLATSSVSGLVCFACDLPVGLHRIE
jgi:hypothetical protein